MTEEELRDLKERVALISDMAGHDGWSFLVDRAHHTLAAKQQRILHGKIDDYTEYQKEVAFIDGAFFVLHLPGMVQRELDEEMTYQAELEEAEEEEEDAA